MNLFPCNRVFRVVIASGQILEYQLNGFDGQSVGVVRCQNGDIGLYRMGQHIQSGICNYGLRHGGYKLRVNDGYIRVNS